MRRLGAVLVICLLVGGCGGSSGTTYKGSEAVAQAAGLHGCYPTKEYVVSNAVECGSIRVAWFKDATVQSHYDLVAQSFSGVGGSHGVYLEGTGWAFECAHRAQCIAAQKKLGGSLKKF
jgi:hypothetical protein